MNPVAAAVLGLLCMVGFTAFVVFVLALCRAASVEVPDSDGEYLS